MVLGQRKRVWFGSSQDQIRALIAERLLITESAYLSYLINCICYVLLNMFKLLAHLAVKVRRPNGKVVCLK